MKLKQKAAFDLDEFPRSPRAERTVVRYRRADAIFAQGDAAETVLYIQKGSVKLSVLSTGGKEAVVGMLGLGEFLGEQALAGIKFVWQLRRP